MEYFAAKSASSRLRWFGRTHPGHRRNNEDAFLGLQFDARDLHHLGKNGDAPNTLLDFAFAVSDGMGGAKAGEFASRLAVDKITRLLPRSFHQTASGLEAGFEDVLTELFDQIHRALVFLGASDQECAGMEATLSLCWFTPAWMYFGHIGDSRIYYLQKDSQQPVKQLSHDDTHVGWLYRQGQISEREARTHPRRSVLQKALGGSNQFVDPQVGAVAYEAGDTFLLCTDGLIDGLYDDRITQVLQSKEIPDPAHTLVEESLQNNGRDNLTALVIQVL